MTVSNDYLAFVLDQLAGLGGVRSRRMFGGAGLYRDEFFFGLIAGDVLYLRVDDTNRKDYTARGMAQFKPYDDRPHLSMSYYETPAEVLENAGELVAWAQRSIKVAMAAPMRPESKSGDRRRMRRKTDVQSRPAKVK